MKVNASSCCSRRVFDVALLVLQDCGPHEIQTTQDWSLLLLPRWLSDVWSEFFFDSIA